MNPREIRSGDVLHLTRSASPQFVRPITVRVIRLLVDWHTYHGWCWMDVYELNAHGDAVDRRSLYVLYEGVRWRTTPPVPAAPALRRPLPRRRVTV
ncbi:hypothetical protein OG777_12230 [Micromonospora peucetia]|uniref:Uncharacterized protein n=1 Tax=Micromonospora peucetia TaxID=47871 RepID=A0A1C6UXQ7_9ACTN|nr:hypothetical protein [Micromonospora peucetia]MCX4387696.1 hypothetical protein [Micromonospora peucetia]WSA35017.1 hypothetical protein OIE14_13685 [Micromonospora peucetia]SCL58811.1 hypothetical protein GA0070608_2043 [Micromonospora peucetia]